MHKRGVCQTTDSRRKLVRKRGGQRRAAVFLLDAQPQERRKPGGEIEHRLPVLGEGGGEQQQIIKPVARQRPEKRDPKRERGLKRAVGRGQQRDAGIPAGKRRRPRRGPQR